MPVQASEIEPDRKGSIPRPDNGSLLIFLDLFYAVVFSDFVQGVYQRIIFEPQDQASLVRYFGWLGVDTPHAYRLGYAGLVFYFVANDWLVARALTVCANYHNYKRFYLDLAVAFLAYGALNRAAQGTPSATLFLVLMLACGVVWSWICLYEDPDGPYRDKFFLLLVTQFFGALVMTRVFLLHSDPTTAAFSVALTADLALYMIGFFAVDDLAHLWVVPNRASWVGPTGLPFVRGVADAIWHSDAVRDWLRARVDRVRRMLARRS